MAGAWLTQIYATIIPRLCFSCAPLAPLIGLGYRPMLAPDGL